MAKLNEKQKLFAKEYLIDRNATKAAERAGYSQKTAYSQGHDLLKKHEVQALISKGSLKREKRTEISQDLVVQRLANIAFGHMGMVCFFNEAGELDLKDFKDLTDNQISIIDSIRISPVSNGDGGLLGYNKAVKLKDSLKALELLCKHLGMLDGSGNKSNKGAAAGRLLDALGRLTKPKQLTGE